MFDTFLDLEKFAKSLPVRLVQGGSLVGHGSLTLDRKNSRLTLRTSALQDQKVDESGWLDITVRTGNDRDSASEIWLHHCVVHSRPHIGTPGAQGTYSVFPNIVVMDAQNLSKSRKIRTASFRLEGISELFQYRIIDSYLPNMMEPDVKRYLQRLQRKNTPDFDLDDVLLVNRVPEPVSFKLNARRYSIFIGGSRKIGSTMAEIGTSAILTINFEQAQSLDFVLDEIWSWKRFFSQVFMLPIGVEALWLRSDRKPKTKVASVYLPNEKRNRLDGKSATITLGEWEDRKRLSRAMKKWLQRDQDRRSFRVAIDRVIETTQKSIGPSDVVKLCAAVESLSELTRKSPFSTQQIEELVEATFRKSETLKLEIPKSRIRGALNLLGTQGLQGKLQQLVSPAEKFLDRELISEFTKACKRGRDSVAHGSGMRETSAPVAMTIIQGLLALCVHFDLSASEVPAKDKRNLPGEPLKQVLLALRRYRELKAAEDKPSK